MDLNQKGRIPKVSVGMPVYNGGKYIKGALDSYLAQTFTDFEVIISDNGSGDETARICREYAEKDSRIRYILQSKNQGAAANFQFVLDQARGEYFMWAAHDDVRSPEFLAVNLDFLTRNLDYVASTSQTRFDGGQFNEIKMGDAGLTGELPQRVVDFFRRWHANARFYSLMRKEAIKNCYCKDEHFLGNDWATVLRLACVGKLNRTAEGWVVLGRKGVSNSKDVFRTFRKTWVDFLCPFAHLSKFTLGLSKNFSLSDKSKILWALLKLNLQAFVWQAVMFAVSIREHHKRKGV